MGVDRGQRIILDVLPQTPSTFYLFFDSFVLVCMHITHLGDCAQAEARGQAIRYPSALFSVVFLETESLPTPGARLAASKARFSFCLPSIVPRYRCAWPFWLLYLNAWDLSIDPHACTKFPDKSNIREKGLILDHSSRA